MLPVTSRLDIFGSTDHRLQFKGVIEVKMTYPSFNGIEKTEMVLALVVPSTSYNVDVPVFTVPNQDNRNGRYGYQNMATAGDSSSGNLRVFID